MTIHTYELERERARAARDEAAYLRELHRIATCGLPSRFTGYHYGNSEVRQSVAMRMADTYLVWAAEYDDLADQIEAGMAGMLRTPNGMTELTNHEERGTR
ncbi:hypothetical protein CSIV_05045 [Microbacterium sp. CSI-V]|uniref:hypothetical protein n=1 Tax=Microbacterium sp. CSI-V TaxID=1933777 RepID=UPI00097BFB9E|nr:hypothetical protein [Microbacterium sp. CSI-V]ONI65647.1 hypothetical protein CSIV_05045 [Microbacterium sp. CSI-V]